MMEENKESKSLKYYADEVKNRLKAEKELEDENRFLRSSVRASTRLRAIEKYRRLVQKEEQKQAEVNPGFEGDNGAINCIEINELIRYLKTKVPTTRDTRKDNQNECSILSDNIILDNESQQWEWLFKVLCDNKLSSSLLMHDKVAKAYEICKQRLYPSPRYRWPILGGLAYDTMCDINKQMIDMQNSATPMDAFVSKNVNSLIRCLSSPLFQNLLIALDGLANTWLIDSESDTDLEEELKYMDELEPDTYPTTFVEQSPISGCFATLAYDDKGRDSYSEAGVRLKYVVMQKGDNEFLGATISTKRNSVVISRIINGGLAQKSNLLHENDELLSVNGIDLVGKDGNTVVEIMTSLRGKIVMLVAPSLDPYANVTFKGIIHLRALFSYEPSEDSCLPCQELGLPFSKGNIIHVTARKDPNWWQAYRNDEEHGIRGALGTLAGLIPSPMYQQKRSIMRLDYWLLTGTISEMELEESSDSDSSKSSIRNRDVRKSIVSVDKPTLKFRFPFFNFPRKKESFKNKKKDATSDIDVLDDKHAAEDKSGVVMNSTVLSSVYAGRMSGLTIPTDINSSNAITEWSAAGPVWGQHGYDLKALRCRRKHSRHKSGVSSSPCLNHMMGKKKKKSPNEYYPAAMNATNGLSVGDDPVDWLNREVARGYMVHSSLWTYEPVAQYIPEPLRRRPVVFVGPAHVGPYQLMQRLIESDPIRFYATPIFTTNTNSKPNSSISYIQITEEEFESKRSSGEFLEWGIFNRCYYGTSKLTVKKLVDEGKVCCLSLRPDSLKGIRSSGLLPYVIFISPPDRVDDLNHLRKTFNLVGTCSDDELSACIDTSRAMEIRYGHWFDRVIVPDEIETTLTELTTVVDNLERQPSWVPKYWLDPTFNKNCW